MSESLRLFVDILQQYSTDCSQELRDTVSELRNPEDLLSSAATVEELAIATWTVVRQRGARLAASQIYFLTRPFDGGEVRLAILDKDRVVLNEICDTSDTLKGWYIVTLAWASHFQAYAAHHPYESIQEGGQCYG